MTRRSFPTFLGLIGLAGSIAVPAAITACATDPEILRQKATMEIRAACEQRGCLEPFLLEVIVNGNLKQYKELKGIPAEPEAWEYLPVIGHTGRHSRATEEFFRLKELAIRAMLGLPRNSSRGNFGQVVEDTTSEQSYSGTVPNPENDRISAPGLLQHGLLSPYTPNAYGPGINMDATGRPFIWQPQWGGTGFPDPTLQVKPDAYGPGIGMDQYGRPVTPGCMPGWVGPC